MAKKQNDIQNDMKWSLDHTGRCGISAFLRPCQMAPEKTAEPANHPLHPICKHTSERVFIVDPDRCHAEALLQTVRKLGHEAEVYETGQAFMSAVKVNPVGCVVLDVNLPDEDGISILDWIVANKFSLSVIISSDARDVGTVVHCMKAGAIEFLPKSCQPIALRNALRQGIGDARKKQCELASIELVEKLVQTLTPTELSVARMIANGLPTKSIASAKGRSDNTAKIHRHRVFTKLKVNSTASVANIMRLLKQRHASDTLSEL